MVFSNFTRTVSGNTITFENTTPIENVGNLKFYKDNASGIFTKKEFRWSFNKSYWASWETLNQGNLTNVDVRGNEYLFFEIRYIKSGSANVTTFSVNYTKATTSGRGITCDVSSGTTVTPTPLPSDYNDVCVDEDIIIDANLLNGQPGSYYLWRPNHKGTQPISSIIGLQAILNNLSYAIENQSIFDAANVGGPGIGVYWGKESKIIYFKTLVEGNKIFLSETPQGNITIAVDDASITALFEELGRLNGINLGGGAGEIFKQKSNDDFQFRTLAPGNANVVITTVGDQVRIALDASVSGAPIWSDPDPISADVGGLEPGDKFSDGVDGSTSIDILGKMLYEYYAPNVNIYTDPSLGYYEKWNNSTAVEVSIYGNFNNDDFVKVRVTDASIYRNGLGDPDPSMASISYPDISAGNFTWRDPTGLSTWADTTYLTKIYNEVGTKQMSPAEASVGIYFVNPYTWGVVDNTVNVNNIDASLIEYLLTQNQLIVPKQSNEINFIRDVSITGIKIKFVYAYDASYGALSSIFDVKNDFNITTSFDSSTVNVTRLAAPGPVPYKVYIKSHWIDVSTFRLIFNI